jgi:hypothetical protein
MVYTAPNLCWSGLALEDVNKGIHRSPYPTAIEAGMARRGMLVTDLSNGIVRSRSMIRPRNRT